MKSTLGLSHGFFFYLGPQGEPGKQAHVVESAETGPSETNVALVSLVPFVSVAGRASQAEGGRVKQRGGVLWVRRR